MFDKIYMALLAAVFFGMIFSTYKFVSLISEPSLPGSRTSAMSPCQCKVNGGCAITFKPKQGLLYADGTNPYFYDEYGFYIGTKDVPIQCKRI